MGGMVSTLPSLPGFMTCCVTKAMSIRASAIIITKKLKSCRTGLANHMGSMSHHITPLVINAIRGTCTYTGSGDTDPCICWRILLYPRSMQAANLFFIPGKHQLQAGMYKNQKLFLFTHPSQKFWLYPFFSNKDFNNSK